MDDILDAFRRRDELLEVMYWMRGERLGEEVAPADLCVFLGDTAEVLADDLAALAADGLVEPCAPGADEIGADAGRFRLTAAGVKEGGRRFADSFAEMQPPGHGECNRPGCVCRLFGPDACVASSGRPA